MQVSFPPSPDSVEWLSAMNKAAMKEAKKRLALRKRAARFHVYRDDPLAFCQKELGAEFTPEIEQVLLSVRDNPVTIARSANGVGKSQPVDTQIPTPDGWRRIGELRVGDYVFDETGFPTEVIGVFPQGMQPTYRVAFNDETEVMASADHLWAFRSSSSRSRGKEYRVGTTEKMIELLHQHISIPMCQPVQYEYQELPIPAYTMGVLLGDGDFHNSVRFTSADEEIIETVTREMTAGETHVVYYDRYRYAILGKKGLANDVITHVRALGLMGARSHEKFIPSMYQFSGVDDRVALLQGLMDTDGYIGTHGAMIFTTTSPQLAEDIRTLVWSLGGTARVSTKKPYAIIDGVKHFGKKAYNVYIRVGFCPFRLSRKAERYVSEEDRQRPIQRMVSEISYIGMRNSVCIRVASHNHLYLSDNYTVTHNSHSAAHVAAWFYKAYPGAQIYVTAAPPLDNLKRVLWGEIMTLFNKHLDVFDTDAVKTLEIKSGPKEFIAGVAIPTSGTAEERQAKFSGKHGPALLFIVDEGDAVPDEVYKGIESCMSGGFARLLIMFNPRAERGPVYMREKTGNGNVVHLSALSHPNVTTGVDMIPGAVTREITVRRINEWTRVIMPGEKTLPNEEFEVPTFLVGETAYAQDGRRYAPLAPDKRKILEPQFYYMVLGEYPAQDETQLISDAWVQAARDRWDAYVAVRGEIPPTGVEIVMGVDVAELGTDYNVACLRHGPFVSRFIPWAGLDGHATAIKCLRLHKENQVAISMVDASGYGSTIAPFMAREGRADTRDEDNLRVIGVKVSEKPLPFVKVEWGEFFSLRDQLWWALREWLRTDPGAMLPPDDLLLEELKVVTYGVDDRSNKIKIMRKDDMRALLKRSPDRADALCLTFNPVRRAKVRNLME